MRVEVRAPVDAVPLELRAPFQSPEAVQLVALEADQARLELAPLATVVGVAVRDTAGAGTTVTVALALVLPPAPVQASV